LSSSSVRQKFGERVQRFLRKPLERIVFPDDGKRIIAGANVQVAQKIANVLFIVKLCAYLIARHSSPAGMRLRHHDAQVIQLKEWREIACALMSPLPRH